ncbi:ankyrin repeat domain-containing protein [Stenotrophomonas maltophilia]|nr:ankyrin repeat domain-containing protein [Stenotrophomonas maltophilia]
MEPQHDNPAGNPGGGDFLNRPHEPLLHPILHPLTLAQFYGKHHEAMATADACQALVLAEQFCRHAQVAGVDTSTPIGFDWVVRPNDQNTGMELELWKGASVALVRFPDRGALDDALETAASRTPALARAYSQLTDDQRFGLLSEIRESIDHVRANLAAATAIEGMRSQPELPSPSQPPLDIAQLLRRFEVPDAQARLAADHIKATYGEALTTMHGSQVLAAAHAHAPHLGLYGAPWQTWLCESATTGNLDGVKACLRMQAEPNVPDANGETPLHLAARHGHPDIVRRLIEAGADPALGNPRGETPLHVAAQHKRAQCCLELMAAGADPGRLDNAGRKPGDAHREKAREQVHDL